MSATDTTTWGSHTIVRFQENAPDLARQTYEEAQADGVSVSVYDGCSERSLLALQHFPGLKVVLLRGFANVQLDALQSLPDLEEISLDGTEGPLDLAALASLRRVSTEWRPGALLNAETSSLESLRLSKYKSSARDMVDFPAFPKLRELELIQSQLQTLQGISKLPTLQRLELYYLSQLRYLGELNLPKLISFVADRCRKISDHANLVTCSGLVELKLHDCGTIASLGFVDSLRSLETFRFINTDVADGDLTPLLRLDDVFFTEKKHFSLKTSAFRQTPRARTICRR